MTIPKYHKTQWDILQYYTLKSLKRQIIPWFWSSGGASWLTDTTNRNDKVESSDVTKFHAFRTIRVSRDPETLWKFNTNVSNFVTASTKSLFWSSERSTLTCLLFIQKKCWKKSDVPTVVASLAQLLEHLSWDRGVVCSNPARGIWFFPAFVLYIFRRHVRIDLSDGEHMVIFIANSVIAASFK